MGQAKDAAMAPKCHRIDACDYRSSLPRHESTTNQKPAERGGRRERGPDGGAQVMLRGAKGVRSGLLMAANVAYGSISSFCRSNDLALIARARQYRKPRSPGSTRRLQRCARRYCA